MKNLYKILILLGMGVFLSSCYYDTYMEVDVPVPDVVSYSADIQPLWNADCISCHGGNAPNLEAPAGRSWTNLQPYVVPGDPENSPLYHTLIRTNKPMPPGSAWAQWKIDLVEKWIEQGAENN